MAYRRKSKRYSDDRFFARWFNHIGYALSNVRKNLSHHFFAYLLTCCVIAVTITLPNLSYVLWKNSNDAAKVWKPTPNLTLYLTQTITEEETRDLLTTLKHHPDIDEVTYMTADEALAEFRMWSGFDSAIDLLEFNPLPAVVIIEPKLNDNREALFSRLTHELSAVRGVDDIKFDDSWLTRLIALTNMVKVVVWVITILMVMAVFLVISNSIRLSIFARRETIHVMQLIGATDMFILRPFLYHGMFIGLCSALLSIGITQLLVSQLEVIIVNVSSLFGIPFSIDGLTFNDGFFILFSASMIGFIAAYAATQRYLRKKDHF